MNDPLKIESLILCSPSPQSTDLDFIRTWTLAIQEILYYRSPPPSIANPYLQLIALSEGHLLTSKQVSTIYDSTSLPLKSHSSLQPFPSNGPLHVFSNFTSQDTVEPQLDLHAEGVENGRSRDFRKAIFQIQFWCQWAVGFDRMPLARRRKGEEKWLEDEGNGIWSRDSMIGSGILGEDEGDEEMNSKSTQTLEGSEAEYLKMKEASYKADLSSMINSDFQRSFSRASEVSAIHFELSSSRSVSLDQLWILPFLLVQFNSHCRRSSSQMLTRRRLTRKFQFSSCINSTRLLPRRLLPPQLKKDSKNH